MRKSLINARTGGKPAHSTDLGYIDKKKRLLVSVDRLFFGLIRKAGFILVWVVASLKVTFCADSLRYGLLPVVLRSILKLSCVRAAHGHAGCAAN